MGNQTIKKVSAGFSFGNQDTGMVIYAAEDGTYEVSALYRSLNDSGFPAQEILRREGRVYYADVDGLVRTMRAVCASDWFHHYRGATHLQKLYTASRWGIELHYEDGTQSRWEGVNDAPSTLGALYDLMVSFGMPSLKLGYVEAGDSFRDFPANDLFSRVSVYLNLFAETYTTDEDDGLVAPFRRLAEEFIEDVQRYCATVSDTASASASMMAWGVVPDLAELDAVDVQQASRAHMMALFEALAQAGDPLDVAKHMYLSGTLERWCSRMAALPEEEARERDQRRKEDREKLLASVDDAIRNRIAQKDVFTAYDVAHEVKATTQQASVRIRSFVRNGELQTVGEDYPRKYRAA